MSLLNVPNFDISITESITDKTTTLMKSQVVENYISSDDDSWTCKVKQPIEKQSLKRPVGKAFFKTGRIPNDVDDDDSDASMISPPASKYRNVITNKYSTPGPSRQSSNNGKKEFHSQQTFQSLQSRFAPKHTKGEKADETAKNPKGKDRLDLISSLAVKNQVLLKEIREDQKRLSDRISKIEVEKPTTSCDTQNFVIENGINLPFKELEDFLEFEEELAEEDFRVKFTSPLSLHFDGKKNLRKTITNILKRYFSKKVALQFVAMKTCGNKRLFRETRMCSCMLVETCFA